MLTLNKGEDMSFTRIFEIQTGLKVENHLQDLFREFDAKEFKIHREYDRVSINDYGIKIVLEDAIVTMKTDQFFISSTMCYCSNRQEESDFVSDFVQSFFEKLKKLMLYHDQLVLNSTGFAVSNQQSEDIYI